ncbi:MAG: hypothetical protein KKF44_00660 [Nanoarchaeota archaeon]|nr:hypothetical protein [Nanoarchaeota archaeon]
MPKKSVSKTIKKPVKISEKTTIKTSKKPAKKTSKPKAASKKPAKVPKLKAEKQIEAKKPAKKIRNKLDDKMTEDVISGVLGEEALPIFYHLMDKEKVSEFEIAEAIKKDIHITRSLLYRFFEHNLATFIRRKDKQKGWYVCYWDFKQEEAIHLFRKMKKERIEALNQRIEREKTNDFYMCRNACKRVDFDRAFQIQFKCPECGDLLNPLDNSRTIEFLGDKLNELKKDSN